MKQALHRGRLPLTADRLSTFLFGYLAAVVAIGILLPILSWLQYAGMIHLSWLHEGGRSLLPWSAFVGAAFVIFRRRIAKMCSDVAQWVNGNREDRYRQVIVGVCLIIFTSYSWQLHIGIAHRGVPGWVYDWLPPVITEQQPHGLSLPPDYDASVFQAALQTEPLRYITESGYASSEVMFLHFKDGRMRPANYALAMVSWPKATFKADGETLAHGKEFMAIVRHNFANERAGGRFLLPDWISYPSHLNYQKIDYSNYPPVEDIVGASFWQITVQIEGDPKTMKIVGAKRVTKVNG